MEDNSALSAVSSRFIFFVFSTTVARVTSDESMMSDPSKVSISVRKRQVVDENKKANMSYAPLEVYTDIGHDKQHWRGRLSTVRVRPK